jgi:hypothetical protein
LTQSWTESYKTSSEIIQYDDRPSIGQLARYAPADTIRFLCIKLRDTIHFWAVGRSTFEGDEGKARIVELIKLIIQEYSWLKPSDIRMVFDNAKKGKYGETYNRMDGALILSWFKLYAEDRIQVAEEISLRKRASAGVTMDHADTRTPEQKKADMQRLADTIGKMAKAKPPMEKPAAEPAIKQIHNYKSVEQYCHANGIDAQTYLHDWERPLVHQIHIRAAELGVDYDIIYYALRNKLLWEINHGLR